MNKDKLYRYLNSEASEEELLEINLWLDRSEDNRKYLAELKAIWVLSTMPQKKADIQNFRGVKRLGKLQRKIAVNPLLFYSAAAILLVMLVVNGIFLSVYLPNRHTDRIAIAGLKTEELSRIYTEKGTKAVVPLPDGSTVWLNSDSEIIYATDFPGSTREVTLSGEAYFKVASDSIKPMIVTTNKGYSVKVLGTEFHIKSYDNDSFSKITLNSGNIKLMYKGKNLKERESEISISPNETVLLGEVKKPEILVQTERITKNDIAWRDGELVFDRTPMAEAVKMIERWHGATFDIKNTSLLKHSITANFKTESLVQILEVIKLLTGIEYSISKDNIVTLQ